MSLGLLYFIFVLVPGISSFMEAVFFLGAFILLGSGALCRAFAEDRNEEAYATAFKWFKNTLKTIAFCMVISIFIPDNKQMLTLIGGYAVTNNEQIQKLPDNVLKAANAYLEGLVEAPKKDE